MNKILDEDSFDLIIDNSMVSTYRAVAGDQIYPINHKMSLVILPDLDFHMCNIGTLGYSSFPSLMTLDSVDTESSNIDKVQNNPNFSLFGQGVLVGIIDTGIDYRHEAFQYSDDTTRIYSIWDQTITTEGKEPKTIPYGTEYTKDDINDALRSENPLEVVPSMDEIGHGTMLAGIICGRENKKNNFKGIVPQCELLVVKLKPAKKLNKEIFCVPTDKICYEESDIIAAFTYLADICAQLHRPIAICLGLGTSQGDHNGRGATSNYLNFITQTPGFGVCVSGGNEANTMRHYYGVTNDTQYKEFELNVDNKDTSFSMEIWVSAPYRLTIDVISPTGETISNIYPRIGICRKLNFILTPSVVYVDNIVSESLTGDQLILIRFVKSYGGVWKFRVYCVENKNVEFHAWLPSADLITKDTYFLDANPNTTLTSPANAEAPLVVSNYNVLGDSISINSSRGYTRDNLIKPNVAVPGYNLQCPIPNNKYSIITGTSASAAHATGIIAMLLEWAIVKGNYTNLTGAEINKMIIRGAKRKDKIIYPNSSWGYGVIDIFGIFEKLI